MQVQDSTDVVDGRKALHALHVLKYEEPLLFESHHVLLRVRRHLDQHSVPLKVRRELNELFDSSNAVANMSLFIGTFGTRLARARVFPCI